MSPMNTKRPNDEERDDLRDLGVSIEQLRGAARGPAVRIPASVDATIRAAARQREATIRLGLEWLAAGGQVVVDVEDDDIQLRVQEIDLSNKHAQADLFLAVKGLLEETVAFRKHFCTAEIDKLFAK